jgi:hypothetical protein
MYTDTQCFHAGQDDEQWRIEILVDFCSLNVVLHNDIYAIISHKNNPTMLV